MPLNAHFSIKPHTVHLWHALLPDLSAVEKKFWAVLDPEELARAQRFRFDIHRYRFVVARGVLRHILSLYTDIAPREIKFGYGDKGKPYLTANPDNIQFNVSHSHDIAIYAFTTPSPIGIDIEKIDSSDHDSVAKRFFSPEEYAALQALSEIERLSAFYKIWSAKEAIIKALGEGLYVPLTDFSIALDRQKQIIALDNTEWHLQSINVDKNYEAAIATPEAIKEILGWQWLASGYEPFQYVS